MKKTKRRRKTLTITFIGAFIGAAGLLSTVSCTEDTLSRKLAKILIEPQPAMGQSALEDPPGMALASIPVFGTAQARFRIENIGGLPLELKSYEVSEVQNTEFFLTLPEEINPTKDAVLSVQIRPLLEDQDISGKILIQTNAGENADDILILQFTGHAVFVGTPTIQICYEGDCYPHADSCTGEPALCTLPTLDFGNVPLEMHATTEILIKNNPAPDTCLPPNGADPCTRVCQLHIEPNPEGMDLGMAFVPDDAGFSFWGHYSLPITVDVENLNCAQEGQTRVLVDFESGLLEAQQESTLYIETNDPAATTLAIPLHAWGRVAPVAVAKLRECGEQNPPPACSYPDAIRPLERIYFDGSESFDPDQPGVEGAITSYSWRVIDSPAGAFTTDFDQSGVDAPFFSFWPPIAGRYVVRLQVGNSDGLSSGISPTSDLEVEVIPQSRVHIQLLWDHSTNDFDLHLTSVDRGNRICSIESDCFWRGCKPDCLDDSACTPLIFDENHPPFEGPNPRLDLDDTHGLGPENINIDAPGPGEYILYTHYYGLIAMDNPPTSATLRIYIDGLLRGEYRRQMEGNDIWRVASFVWAEDGSVEMKTELDSTGEIGALRQMLSCPPQGHDFDSLF